MPINAIGSSAGQSSGLASVAEKDQLGQAQFMQLMIAQLRNQDPTKPMDPSEFLGQLAQFGTVSGIQDMQNSLSTLSDALRSQQVLGGTSLVGHHVLAASETASLAEGGIVEGAVNIPEGTSTATLVVTDASGQLVRRMPLSAQQGENGFRWDGLTDQGQSAPAGTYTMKAIANIGGLESQVETQIASRVGSVTLDPNNYTLTLNTDLGPIPLSRVRRVM
jgi:flagellar basal-body rod modification protein FlgD